MNIRVAPDTTVRVSDTQTAQYYDYDEDTALNNTVTKSGYGIWDNPENAFDMKSDTYSKQARPYSIISYSEAYVKFKSPRAVAFIYVKIKLPEIDVLASAPSMRIYYYDGIDETVSPSYSTYDSEEKTREFVFSPTFMDKPVIYMYFSYPYGNEVDPGEYIYLYHFHAICSLQTGQIAETYKRLSGSATINFSGADSHPSVTSVSYDKYGDITSLRIYITSTSGTAYTSYDISIYAGSTSSIDNLIYKRTGATPDSDGVIEITTFTGLDCDNLDGEINIDATANGGDATSSATMVVKFYGRKYAG